MPDPDTAPSLYLVGRSPDERSGFFFDLLSVPSAAGEEPTMTRAALRTLVKRIAKGESFHTGSFATGSDGRLAFFPGVPVFAVPRQAPKFLTTSQDDAAEDNLAQLPLSAEARLLWALVPRRR